MRVLFDQGTPVPLRHHLTGHNVATAYELGWSSLTNGELLGIAESQGFDVLATTDSNLKYQQNLQARIIAIVVLTTTSWRRIQVASSQIQAAVDAARPGSYSEVAIP